MVHFIRTSLVVALMLGAGPAFAQKATVAADDLSLLPVDSELVAGIDFQQVQKSLLWKQLVVPGLAKGEIKDKLAEFQTTCGIDPMKLVTKVAIGLKGIGDPQPDGVIVAHGVPKAKVIGCFDKMTKLENKDSEITRDGDVLIVKQKADNQTVGVAFVDDSTAVLVVGTAATGDGVRAITKGTSALKTSAKFVEVYKKTNTKDTVWMIMRGTSKAFDDLRAQGIQPLVLFGSLKVTKDLDLDVRVGFKTADEAKNLATLAQGQLKSAVAMFDKITVDAVDTELKLLISLSDKKLKELLKQFPVSKP